MAVNPSAAQGSRACTTAQMGLLETEHPGPFPIRFNGAKVECPPASKVGTVMVNSPLVDQSLEGDVYLAKQFDNPFHSLLGLYIAVRSDELGVSAKLAGEVVADPKTGQLTTVFDQNPQLPVRFVRLHIFDGPRAALRTPATCGTKTTTSELTPWSAQNRFESDQGRDFVSQDS